MVLRIPDLVAVKQFIRVTRVWLLIKIELSLKESQDCSIVINFLHEVTITEIKDVYRMLRVCPGAFFQRMHIKLLGGFSAVFHNALFPFFNNKKRFSGRSCGTYIR